MDQFSSDSLFFPVSFTNRVYERFSDLNVSGREKVVPIERMTSRRMSLRERIRMNERNFTLLMFVISMSILVVKLYINHGSVVSNMTIIFFQRYGWVIKAILNLYGLGIAGLSWYIIYKGNDVSGIKPSFALFKKRLAETTGMQISYLVCVLIGILLFSFMSI